MIPTHSRFSLRRAGKQHGEFPEHAFTAEYTNHTAKYEACKVEKADFVAG